MLSPIFYISYFRGAEQQQYAAFSVPCACWRRHMYSYNLARLHDGNNGLLAKLNELYDNIHCEPHCAMQHFSNLFLEVFPPLFSASYLVVHFKSLFSLQVSNIGHIQGVYLNVSKVIY